MRFLICAGSYSEASAWAHSRDIKAEHAKVVIDTHWLEGMRMHEWIVVYLPGFDSNPQADNVRRVIVRNAAMTTRQLLEIRVTE